MKCLGFLEYRVTAVGYGAMVGNGFFETYKDLVKHTTKEAREAFGPKIVFTLTYTVIEQHYTGK